MKIKLYDKEGNAKSFDDILTPLIEKAEGEVDNLALVDLLDTKIRKGDITMSPDPDSMRRAILQAALVDWERHGQESGARRFLNNREGHRFDRRAANIILLDEERRVGYANSIRQYLFTEGPQAFASQAALLLLLDPSETRLGLAERASVAVRAAILDGDKEDEAEKTA